MNSERTNDINAELAVFETPFADVIERNEIEPHSESVTDQQFSISEIESPFVQTFEASSTASKEPLAEEFIGFLSELNDNEFSESLYELAYELEDHFNSKISDISAMGESFLPYASQQAGEYFLPLINETNILLDKASEHFSGNNIGDHTEAEIEQFFAEFETDHPNFSPAQEQFFGKILKKVKSVVKKGIDLAKKGIKAVGKILPINIILQKLKGLIKPLLNRVLKFAIGKLPLQLRPHAQRLAKKLLNLENVESEAFNFEEENPTSGDLESVQYEFDNYLTQLVFSDNQQEQDAIANEFELTGSVIESESDEISGSTGISTIETARQNFINELKNLKPGESPQPAIEQFVPIVLALKPAIKIAISLIGRKKIVNFLAGLLAKLVSKYVPENVSRPLATSIVDVGMRVIGFETVDKTDNLVAYEAIASTIEETIGNLENFGEEEFADQQYFTAQVLEAFENAAANNFPAEYIKEELRPSSVKGIWILKPRKGTKQYYKKFSHVFQITIEPRLTKRITTFRGIPLYNFLRDKLDLDMTRPVQARVHLYESIPGTWLKHISRYENIPGLNGQPFSWVQFHPLTTKAASALLKEPMIGVDISPRYMQSRHRIAVGQRFYYLEIPGARLKLNPIPVKNVGSPPLIAPRPGMVRPPMSSDIQGIINFQKSEIQFNYFFSEEDAKTLVEKLNRNDLIGAFQTLRYSIRNVLHGILVQNIGTKVKIIHEAVPEMYLENIADVQEFFTPLTAARGVVLGASKEILSKLIEKLIDKIAELAMKSITNFFKARAAEFKHAQMQPQQGVTVKIIWMNIPGMSSIKAIINAIRGKMSLGNLSDLVLPNIPSPEIKVLAGKHFD